MRQPSRRDFLQIVGLTGVVGLGSAALRVPVDMRQADTAMGTVLRIAKGPVTLHSYVATEASFAVTLQVIETPNRLIVVDTQYQQSFSRDARAYIDSLDKPIDRVILSHEHPDHWSGANNFADVPFYATAATIARTSSAVADGMIEDLVAVLGPNEAPDVPNVPSEPVAVATETIDGIAFEYEVYTHHESAESLVIRLPEARTMVLQDLLYVNTHFFPGQDRENWLAILEALRTQDGYDLLLVGHGLPTTTGGLDLGIEYLNFVQQTIPTVEDGSALIAALEARYPSFGGAALVAFWNRSFPR